MYFPKLIVHAAAVWDKGWLRYDPVGGYGGALSSICLQAVPTVPIPAVLNSTVGELQRGLEGLLALTALPPVRVAVECISSCTTSGELILTSGGKAGWDSVTTADEGHTLRTTSCSADGSLTCTLLSSASDRGLLYGAFALLRRLQTNQSISALNVTDAPQSSLRVWNLWDNYDGSIERGYAGRSIFQWEDLPATVSPRLADYARLLASAGINQVAMLNVNACAGGNDQLLSAAILRGKLALVAGIFAKWGLGFFITACFASPIHVGGLKTADPEEQSVQEWWRATSALVKSAIPSFQGYLMKADSEGNPGPATYHRNQSQGANMLARALAPVGGTMLWRAFEYGGKGDRATLAAETFVPYDGEFDENVVLQVKNGPLDFQAREPGQALFGAMTKTRVLMEVQATQEYLGQTRALAQLASQWEYYLRFPVANPVVNAADGAITTVADVVTSESIGAGMAAVSNFGNDSAWAGTMAMANAFSFGRQAWAPRTARAEDVLGEWVAMTWGLDPAVNREVLAMSKVSWEVFENYTSPLGVGFCEGGDHFSPVRETAS
jgi:alpha-glucuronidase